MAYKVPGAVPFDLRITSLAFSLHLGHGSLLIISQIFNAHPYPRVFIQTVSSAWESRLPENHMACSLTSHVCSNVTFSVGPALKTFIYNCISLCIAFSCFVFLVLIIYLFILLWSIFPPHLKVNSTKAVYSYYVHSVPKK